MALHLREGGGVQIGIAWIITDMSAFKNDPYGTAARHVLRCL